MLINAVDYMMPSILKSFHIDIIDNETYIATPIAIYNRIVLKTLFKDAIVFLN